MSIVVFDQLPHTILREVDDWGIRSFDLIGLPRRLWADQPGSRPVFRPNVDPLQTAPLATPAGLLGELHPSDNWSAQTKRSLARLQALMLIAEDPQRRMDARDVVTLAHQVSLVRHIADQTGLKRVLIGDEVGLGKTVEAGLLIHELIEANPGLRILYLAPARLVSNVAAEFSRMQLSFRQWKAQDSDARIESDDRIIASIHRAVHPSNFDRLLALRPWDVIVVDECHHLSDWASGGGDPVRKYRLVRELVAKQPSDGYVLLLSGTPHQGHSARFENLLSLLKRPSESDEAVAGRVIFRTKEDVRDWEGNPLFPRRKVNPPQLVDLGDDHATWLSAIHAYFSPAATGTSETVRRAAGWKCAQALQWAASSPNAGLGYLVRQALRAGWSLGQYPLDEAIASLRPYRTGVRDEPVESVYQRLMAEIARQADVDDIDDIEEFVSAEDAAADAAQLGALLERGIRLVSGPAQPKWDALWNDILEPAGNEKVVLFAQPIETVMALSTWLEAKSGQKPAIIIGGQSEVDRAKQVSAFRSPEGPRFLISSRAGTEGFNLQVSRRLVHLDVPWNPMELEQRVGRVHRFGSKQTIIVDTLVVRGSRETHAWAVARDRLSNIARTLVAADRFDSLFSRVMCLIPPDELQTVLLQAPTAPLGEPEVNRLSTLVDSGFQQWQEFHDRFSENQKQVRNLNPGIARWTHLRDFLLNQAGAAEVGGFQRGTFVQNGDEVEFKEVPIMVVKLRDGTLGLAEDFEAGLLTGDAAEKVRPLGLNVPQVNELLREHAMPKLPTGAAHLRWSEKYSNLRAALGDRVFVLAFLRQMLRLDPGGGITEIGCSLHVFVRSDTGEVRELGPDEKRELYGALSDATVRLKPEENLPLDEIKALEKDLAANFRRPSDEEIRDGIRYAVWPLLAAHLGT
jgi:superfamily II DNA or RNA helicase